MEPREPRFPRINYNTILERFINQQNDVANSKTSIQIQFLQNNVHIPKKVYSCLTRADSKGNVRLRKNLWESFNMSQICKNIKAWHIQKSLHICNEQRYKESTMQPQLLSQLSNISFSSLKSLNLSNNGIQSIQSLCTISFPNLERLVLSHNRITNIRSLRKSHFPSLLSCSLGSNRILQYNTLGQLKAANLKRIYQQHRSEPGWCGTFTWIGKLQTNDLESLWVASDNRIWQKSAQNSFERKYLKKKQITFYVGLNFPN